MKVITILGTRPEIIRLSLVMKKLDQSCEHIIVHTGQNFDPALSDLFFEQLDLRAPDYHLGIQCEHFGDQIGKIISATEKIFISEKPDRLLILGDTNSALSSIVAKRMGIPVFHMEAGNRCFDDHVPEEVNRRIIDHTSDILMPYTERSRSNLLREGIESNRIFVTGNPIKEVLNFYNNQIDTSQILNRFALSTKEYFLITLHRAENVDNSQRLDNFINALEQLHSEYKLPIICSLHPRTRSQLLRQKKSMPGVQTIEPLGLFDFVNLEKNAKCVLSDSGTVQEECCIFNVPAVTLRDVTERPETIEVGSNIISGSQPQSILRCVKTALKKTNAWTPPPEYSVLDTSMTVTKIITGYYRNTYEY